VEIKEIISELKLPDWEQEHGYQAIDGSHHDPRTGQAAGGTYWATTQRESARQ